MKEQDAGVKWFNTVLYPRRKTGRAVRYEDGVLPRLREKEITFFTPWGPRYSWETRGVKIQDGDKEIAVLDFFADLFGELQQGMPEKEFRWLFLGADTYGIRINHLPSEVVGEYFQSLAERLGVTLPIAEFRLWSEFDAEAESIRTEIRANFRKFVGFQLLAQAEKTARKMGRGGNPREYLIERLAEARLVETELHPIKVSCVGRHKDDGVDADLPRLYFLPEELHAPWL